MTFIKMTSNGQVTIPAPIRKIINVEYFICDFENGAVVFRPVEVSKHKRKKPKYTMQDLLDFTFESKNPDETYADKIDEIVYDL